jgi:ubiquitin-protein ligase
MVVLFRFQILVPDNYPDGDCPRVVFEGPVFHPHVDPLTHQLNVKQVRVVYRC